MDLKNKLETTTKNHQASIQNLKAKFDRFADKQSARPSGSLPSNTQPNPEADLGASINVMSYSLYVKLFLETLKPTKMSIRAMTLDENFESKSDTEEPPFEKITFNTDYKIKTTLEEPPTDLELKPLLDNLEYVFLEEPSFLPVIISSPF
ncbi:hypothetical protein Tco_0879838 [Tanacetum coccineum]